MELTPGAVSRRAVTAGFGAGGALTLLPWAASPAAAATTSVGAGHWARRAEEAYAALQRYLYLPASGLYAESHPTEDGENPYSYVWPLREALGAVQDVNQLPPARRRYDRAVRERLAAVERYFDPARGAYDSYPPAPLGGGGDPFYDDNGVIGLEQIRRYRFAGDVAMLRRARRTFAFVEQAWDPAGGMHWVDAAWNPYRGATNVTSIASELAAHLYETTGRNEYLRWAERTYDWVFSTMRTGQGIYANGVRFDGVVEETRWTYNSGFMIGAATLLWRSTGDRSWLRRAETDFEGALEYWTSEDRLYGQPAVFNAIFFANLQLFCSERPQHTRRVMAVLEQYAERVWRDNRDARTGLFTFQTGGGGLPDPAVRPQTLGQSAVTQLFTLLAWPRKNFADAT